MRRNHMMQAFVGRLQGAGGTVHTQGEVGIRSLLYSYLLSYIL
jgi:hypothetical protein